MYTSRTFLTKLDPLTYRTINSECVRIETLLILFMEQRSKPMIKLVYSAIVLVFRCPRKMLVLQMYSRFSDRSIPLLSPVYAC